MRDPARIPVVLDAIRKLWEANPDLRFVLIVSLLQAVPGLPPPFIATEDDVFMKAVLKLAEGLANPVHLSAPPWRLKKTDA